MQHGVNYTKWWQRQLGRPVYSASRFREGPPSTYTTWTAAYPFDVPAETIVRQYADHQARQEHFGDGYPFFWPNFGPGVFAAALGANPKIAPNTIWFEPVENLNDLDDLRIEFNADHPWWRRIVEITRAACRVLPPDLPVGFTDLGGNLDILSSLVGAQRLLVELCDKPDIVEKLTHQITEAWLKAYDQLHAIIAPARPGTISWPSTLWAPGRCYMLQSDFSYMISPAMFERFVLPDLTRCCEHIEYSFYHLDGPGELPHLPMLCRMKSLKGIQWIPGAGNPPAAEWPQVIQTILDAGKLCQISATVDQALELLERFPCDAFSLILVGGINDGGQFEKLQQKMHR